MLIYSRVLLWPFAAVGIIVIALNITENDPRRIAKAEVLGSPIAAAFGALLLGQAYRDIIRHDRPNFLPEFYAGVAIVSAACPLLLTAGLLDFLRGSPKRAPSIRPMQPLGNASSP